MSETSCRIIISVCYFADSAINTLSIGVVLYRVYKYTNRTLFIRRENKNIFLTFRVQATWLSRLHEAQESYREACRRPDNAVPGGGPIRDRSSSMGTRGGSLRRHPNVESDMPTGSGVVGGGGACLPGVNINVMQCEENASFNNSMDDIAGQQLVLCFS